MDEKDRQNRMARLVFNKGNLEQLRSGLDALIGLYADLLDQPFEHGSCFTHDDILDRMDKIEQSKWRPIRNMFLLDPFYGYSKGNFSEDEKISPAKLMLDFIHIFDQINTDTKNKLMHYENVVKTLNKEKSDTEIALSKAERSLREERAFTNSDKTELKTAQGSIKYLESVVQEKNEKIAELSREQNVQLWDREKERIFAVSDKQIKGLEAQVEDQKRQNATLTKKLAQIDDSNKMLRMKNQLAKGTIPPTNVKSEEELKRAIYLLEKDVIFLEQQLYTQQRLFVTVLCGLKTDLFILGDNLTDPDTGQIIDKDFVRVCDITKLIHSAMMEGELTDVQQKLPPHYSYLPNDFKIKRVKRVSRSSLPPLRQEGVPESSKGATVRNEDIIGEVDEGPIVENPCLVDSISKEVNTTTCMRYFPHMSMDFIKEHWTKFKEFDADGNENLDFSEVVKALTCMGLKFTAQQAEEAMREADVNKSKTLDFYEYLIVADKLFSKKGHSELFHIGAAKDNRKVMAKTCVVQ